MISAKELDHELLDAGKAIDLIADDGGLNPDWFDDPLARIGRIISNPSQLAALLRLVDALLPPVPLNGVPDDENWHPLLGDQPDGNLYLTVKNLKDAAGAVDGVQLGVGGDFGNGNGPGLSASLRVQLPLVSAKATVEATPGPLRVDITIHLGWSTPAQPIRLDAIVATASIGTSAGLVITLKKLALDGSEPRDTILDPEQLSSEAVHLILGLLKNNLQNVGPGAEAQAVANHLPALLGLDGGVIPPLPITQLFDGPSALQVWFKSLLQGATPPITVWLNHLGELIGGPSPATVTGTGIEPDPWRVRLIGFGGAESGLNITLFKNSDSLFLGIEAQLAPSGSTPVAKIEARAIMASIPLNGTATAAVLPSASIAFRAPGSSLADNLVNDPPQLVIKSLQGGLRWNGSSLEPMLELDGVTLEGTQYERLDLTNTDSVVAAVKDAVQNAIKDALGTGAGAHLAALAGIIAPASDPLSPNRVDAAILLSNPARAIAQFHRNVLLDATHNWSFMLSEMAALLGLSGGVSGTGVQSDPWRVSLISGSESSASIEIDLCAWNAQRSGNPAEPQLLRVGLRASAENAPLQFAWLSELLAFDLPKSDEGSVSLMAGQHASLLLAPVPTAPPLAGIALSADKISAEMNWTPGSSMMWQASVDNLQLTADGATISIPAFHFPPAIAFDMANPAATAAGFGISVPDLELLLRVLLARAAFSWGGMPGLTLAGLLGLHKGLPGFQIDWPALGDPGALGSLLDNPFAALRAWLGHITIDLSSDGSPFIFPALSWLRSLLSNSLPALPSASLPDLSISGSGTYEDPWALPLSTGPQSADALMWLEPDGPPSNWANILIGRAAGASDFRSLLEIAQSLAAFLPSIRDAFGAISSDAGEKLTALASALSRLDDHFTTSDGVVPLTSQVPTGGSWTAGTIVSSPHHLQPRDPAAITQILSQIDTLAGGATATRVMLLVGPSLPDPRGDGRFTDHTIWQDLLSHPNRHGTIDPAANFNLRVTDVDPSAVDLTSVTAAVDYYTADLKDDGSGDLNALVKQIERIVDRIGSLRPNVPVTLVAHSTAGVPARAFTAAHSDLVRGLVTIGTPHGGATLPFLTDPALADAIRVIQSLRAGMSAPSPVRDVLDHFFLALDGFIPAHADGELPAPAPYPVASFAGALTNDTGGRPAMAIGGRLTDSLFDLIRNAIGVMAAEAANGARALPTHAGFGARAWLALPNAAPGDVSVDASLRADAFRVKLRDGVPESSRPSHALSVDMKLSRPGGWLLGSPSSFAGIGLPAIDVRVRDAELGVLIQADSSNALKITPRVVLHQASNRGPMLSRVDLKDGAAQVQALLGAVLQAVTVPPPAANSPVNEIVAAWKALGVAVADPHGGFGISADAFSGIIVDAASFFGSRLQNALDGEGGLAGLRGPSGGPWTMPLPGLPLEVYLSRASNGVWRSGLRTTPGGTGELPLGDNAALSFDANVSMPGFVPSLDAKLRIGGLSLSYASSTQELVLQALPCLQPIKLLPAPSVSALAAELNDVLPRMLFSSSAGSLLEALIGHDLRLGPLDCFLAASGDFFKRSSSLGNSAGDGLDASKLTGLLNTINILAGLSDGPGLQFPAGLQLTASGAGTEADPVKLTLSTTAPIGGVLNVQLAASIDRQLHVSPAGTTTLTIPLNGIAPQPHTWNTVSVTFGVDASGVSLVVAPQGVEPIRILPTFSGLGVFGDAAKALLPAALDKLVLALSTPGPQPVWLTPLLTVAGELGLYDDTNKFAGHADQLKALVAGGWLSSLGNRNNIASAVASLINDIGLSPQAVATGSIVQWEFPLIGSDAGTISVAAGWDSAAPMAKLTARDLKFGNGAVEATVEAGFESGTIQCSAELGVNLQNALNVNVAPKLRMARATTGGSHHFKVDFFPLATSGASGVDGPLRIELTPTPGVYPDAQADPSAAQQLIEHWLVPLTADLVFDAFKTKLDTDLWSGGPSLRKVLAHAKLLAALGDNHLNPTLPKVKEMITGVVSGLAGGGGISIDISNTLKLSVVERGGRLGVHLTGHQDFSAGSFELSFRFGAPGSWVPASNGPDQVGSDFGVAVFLFTTELDGSITFDPGLFVAGLGLGLSGADDAPLINTSGFRIGAARLYMFFDLEPERTPLVQSLGGGLELLDLGLPLGLATSGNVGGDNPVASNLLQSGQGSTGGDPHPVNPGVDVDAWLWKTPAGDGNFGIQFGGKTGTLWIGVHRGFGPVYIDQVGLDVGQTFVELLIDGSVKVDGLTAQVDDLTIKVPYQSILDPKRWTLDLRGLAIGFKSPGVTIAGGLLKNDGPPIEYDGMLLIQITKFGFVAVGAYSTPTDPGTGETYASLFVFAGVFIVIGLPPIIEIEGIGLGVGYNRQLLPPDDLKQVPNFVLVSVLDDSNAMVNDPMGTLRRIQTQMPAKRGSFWLAVGLRGTSFEIVHVTAVVYIALDRGVEIGLVGVARMALPSDSSALVNIEMALKARFSAEEGIFSVQGQLTSNSWLISHDCQLTGGFAYFAWFKQSQFLVTVGGYHPSFHKPTEFPDVPRVGYHWVFLGVVNLKGESYFALTNSCVMFGTRLEATYGPDWIQIWFTAYADLLISWDPFYYDARIGMELGARFSIKIHLIFKTVRITVSVSVGATLHIQGPPFHGSVTVSLAIASVTVSFGPNPNPTPRFISWNDFKAKYLRAGDPADTAVTVHVVEGLLPPEPPGGQPAPGTESQPWKMASEFTFDTETRMPATQHVNFISGRVGPDASLHLAAIDVSPMGKESAVSEHLITLEVKRGGVWGLIGVDPSGAQLDPSYIVDSRRFKVERLIGQVSEATYHFIDHDHIPAAANTLPVITGVRITAFAVLVGPSKTIQIMKLVDSGNSRPLPFATLTPPVLTGLQLLGSAADQLMSITANANSAQTIAASRGLLSGSGFFSQARIESGLPATGLTPLATRALESYRSSPPLITPITTGLTMKPVGQPAPPVINEVAPVRPVDLSLPRLRGVLQAQPPLTADAPPSVHTTVDKTLANLSVDALRTGAGTATTNIPRMTPPSLQTIPGARLEFTNAANAQRPTGLAGVGRTLRNAEVGWAGGAAHIAEFKRAEKQVRKQGVTLPAAATHIWEVPNAASRSIVIDGDAAVRVTCLTRGGRILSDKEQSARGGATIQLPGECGMVAVTCLGRLTSIEGVSPGLGAVSLAASPQGRFSVVGWQTGNLIAQVSSTALLGRGACLMLSQPFVGLKNGQRTTQAMLRVSNAMFDQQGIETWLPAGIGTVGIILDQQNVDAAAEGDLSVAVTRAKLQTPPLRVEGGRRKLLLYDVTDRETNADHIVIAAASLKGSRFAGVVGLPGRAQEWAARMNGGVPEHLVADGPLTPDGQVTVRIMLNQNA